MISLIESREDRDKMLTQCQRSAFGCKIAAIAQAYSFDKSFAYFWTDDSRSSVFCLFDGLMLISGTIQDAEEAKAFIRAVDAESIMCAVRNSEILSMKADDTGDVLSKKLPDSMGEESSFEPYVNIRDIYQLLTEENMVDEFEPFYLDFSHKLRHGNAFAETFYENKDLCGAAVVSSLTEQSAVLSAIVVREGYRRRGIASGLIGKAESKLPGRTVYVLREKDANKEFYEVLGYKKTDTWVCGKL